MRILTLLVLTAAVSYHVADGQNPSTTEDYDGYVRALEVFKLAYEFSTEEPLIRKPLLNPKAEFGWSDNTWSMGVRGRDVWGKWTNSECMAVMILPQVALMPCSCMWSWYTSFIKGGNFKEAEDKTDHDITAPELFLFHTVHPSSKDKDKDYFKDEVTQYYTVLNWPLRSQECDAGVQQPPPPWDPVKIYEQLYGFGIVELETPIIYGDGKREKIPLTYNTDDYSKLPYEFNMHIMTYGARFLNPNQYFVPKFATADWNEKKDRWKVWSNTAHLRNELVHFLIRPAFDGCRDKYNWKQEPLGFNECWQPKKLNTQICNILVGAPVMTEGILYGMVMNYNPCSVTTPDMRFEVRRINNLDNNKRNPLRMMPEYSKRVVARRKALEKQDRPQRLFNYTLGSINYDEDIDPAFRFKVKYNITLNPGPLGPGRKRSNAPPRSSSFALIVMGISSLWLHHSK